MRVAIVAYDGATRNAGDWTGKAVIQALFESTSVEGIKVGVEGGVALIKMSDSTPQCRVSTHVMGLKMGVGSGVKLLAEKVPHVTDDNKQDIAMTVSVIPI